MHGLVNDTPVSKNNHLIKLPSQKLIQRDMEQTFYLRVVVMVEVVNSEGDGGGVCGLVPYEKSYKTKSMSLHTRAISLTMAKRTH